MKQFYLFAFPAGILSQLLPLYNENCPDGDKAEICENSCISIYEKCSAECSQGSGSFNKN